MNWSYKLFTFFIKWYSTKQHEMLSSKKPVSFLTEIVFTILSNTFSKLGGFEPGNGHCDIPGPKFDNGGHLSAISSVRQIRGFPSLLG